MADDMPPSGCGPDERNAAKRSGNPEGFGEKNRPYHHPAKERRARPFEFFTRLNLTQLLGLKALNLTELLQHIRAVPGSSIYHHTHRFLQQHIYLSPEPPNDFAYWVTEVLGDERLGERLASIDTIQYSDIRSLRDKIASTLERYLEENPRGARKFADEGEEFHMMASMSFILSTGLKAGTLPEFATILETINVDSIYFHMFESRLKLHRPSNDFSVWLDRDMGLSQLAAEFARLDPYTQTLEGLRKSLLHILGKRRVQPHGHAE